ncbi:MAG: hypothetical protein KDB14_02435 [Planctomycetales bacterium]|nr:hypothetical protein [Planctomycetales bacterium]
MATTSGTTDWRSSDDPIGRMLACIKCLSLSSASPRLLGEFVRDENCYVRMLAICCLGEFAEHRVEATKVLSECIEQSNCDDSDTKWFIDNAEQRLNDQVARANDAFAAKLANEVQSAGPLTSIESIAPIALAAIFFRPRRLKVQGLRLLGFFKTRSTALFPAIEKSLLDEHYTVRLAAVMTAKSVLDKNTLLSVLEPLSADENDLVRQVVSGVSNSPK